MLYISILSILLFVTLNCEAFKVKINNDQIVEVDQRINGNKMKQYNAISMDFLKNTNWKETILKIENFDYVQRISIEENVLTIIPAIEDNPELRELSLNYNRITAIHTSQFFSTELSKISIAYNSINSIFVGALNKDLEDLNLRCNQIQDIQSSWFTRPDNLKILDMSNNKISSIKSRLFRSFTQLTKLNLSGNRIKIIEPGSFTFKEMHILDLSLNKISELNPRIFFENSIELSSLNVTYNNLNFLSELFLKKVFDDAPKERQIAMFGNPWQCQCLSKLEKLLRQYQVTQNEPPGYHGEANCVVSLLYPTQCAELLEEELTEIYRKYLPRPKPFCTK